MTLQQIRYLCAVVRAKLNMSRAADALGASQPAVSQQIKALEETLGVPIFVRGRNRLVGLTPKGETIVAAAQNVLADVVEMERAAERRPSTAIPQLRIVSTHPQARYTLPRTIRQFQSRCPGVGVHVTHRYEEKFWQLVQNGQADIAVTTDPHGAPSSLLTLPCYPMKRSLIAPKGHSLLQRRTLTLEDIAQHTLVGYDERSNGHRRLMRAFAAAGLAPRIAVNGADEDVIKACVEEGLGVAILASIVYNPKRDVRLGSVDVTSLLEPSVTSVIIRRKEARVAHIQQFIECFAPKWTREALREVAEE